MIRQRYCIMKDTHGGSVKMYKKHEILNGDMT